MTRSNSRVLYDLDLNIERTLHRLKVRNSSNAVTSLIVVSPTFVDPFIFYFHSCNSENSKTENMDNNCELSLKELVTPNIVYQPWCAQYPENQVNYDLKSRLIHLLPKFHGLVGEDPHKHLKDFHVVCSTMRPQGVPKDHVKMKAFPFSLDGVSKDWFYFLPTTITTLHEMKRLFLENIFPTSRTTTIRKEICGIR
uniref:Retrotransposon gag domain-containing protein n=1 Tax=Cajanus cajan TaxID=3821 RepID=A0A151RV23_CAJCA|nr:hypothetical protein KK1_032048 [Cajanus cajan]